MPTLDDFNEVRARPVIDGELKCWRCDGGCDETGFCGTCGAVTLPTPGAELPPTSSTAAIGRLPIADELELDPDPLLNALDFVGIAGGELRGFGAT